MESNITANIALMEATSTIVNLSGLDDHGAMGRLQTVSHKRLAAFVGAAARGCHLTSGCFRNIKDHSFTFITTA